MSTLEEKLHRRVVILALRGKGLTQEEVGNILGLTRQRINQIEHEPEAADAVVESNPETLLSQKRVKRERGESRMNINRRKIAALREAGKTYPEIAAELNISTGYAQVLNGSDGRRGGSRPTQISDVERMKRDIRWYHSKDLPPKIIASVLDIPVATINYHMKQMGLNLVPTENERLLAEGKRRCVSCHEVKELGQFKYHPKGNAGRLNICNQCKREGFKFWSNKGAVEFDVPAPEASS